MELGILDQQVLVDLTVVLAVVGRKTVVTLAVLAHLDKEIMAVLAGAVVVVLVAVVAEQVVLVLMEQVTKAELVALDRLHLYLVLQ